MNQSPDANGLVNYSRKSDALSGNAAQRHPARCRLACSPCHSDLSAADRAKLAATLPGGKDENR